MGQGAGTFVHLQICDLSHAKRGRTACVCMYHLPIHDILHTIYTIYVWYINIYYIRYIYIYSVCVWLDMISPTEMLKTSKIINVATQWGPLRVQKMGVGTVEFISKRSGYETRQGIVGV